MSTRIMLVDDEVHFVETFAKRLEKRGLSISTARSGQEALDKLRGEAIDVIILDVKMPGMDGVETLREIKRNHPLIEVIMLTGHATVPSAIDGMKLGALDYLIKPCDLEVILAKIQEAKQRKALHEERILEAHTINQALQRD